MHGQNDSPDEHKHSDKTHREGEDGAGKHWMQGAVKHPGSFTADAKKHHTSVHAFAEKEKNASGTVGKRARLALVFEKAAKNR